MEKPLFEAQIRHDPDADPIDATDGQVFPYLGSGDGTVSGPRVEGALRWSFFEEQGQPVCRARRIGLIDTADGAAIELEELGFFFRDGEGSSRWRFAGGLRLTSADRRYAWLARTPALLEGDFDTASGRGRLRAWALDAGSDRDG